MFDDWLLLGDSTLELDAIFEKYPPGIENIATGVEIGYWIIGVVESQVEHGRFAYEARPSFKFWITQTKLTIQKQEQVPLPDVP